MEANLKSLLSATKLRKAPSRWPTEGIQNLAIDSRRVTPGSLFFALPGQRTDGRLFVDQAIARGAVAIVTEAEASPRSPVPMIEVENARVALAEVAATFFDNPQRDLTCLGVTGTNGKTTVSALVQHLLRATADPLAGLIGTIRYDLGARSLPAFRTTPEALDVFNLLAQMRENGSRYAALEVSSHAIAQHRVHGLGPEVLAFTNLTQDHLDFHGSMEAYFEAKASAFFARDGQPAPRVAIVNRDDAWGQRLLGRIENPTTAVTCSLQDPSADWFADQIELSDGGTRFRLHHQGQTHWVETPLIGHFNVSNLLVAFASVASVGIDAATLIEAHRSFEGVPGRLERVSGPGQPTVVVDYAHTDDALRNVLGALRPLTQGRLHVVFGCGGNRDRAKRPLMMQAACDGADLVYATADNPRREDLDTIFADMRDGVDAETPVQWIADRRLAIGTALQQTAPGDLLLIAGKGHEAYQEVGDVLHPFDDRQVARELLSRNLTPSR